MTPQPWKLLEKRNYAGCYEIRSEDNSIVVATINHPSWGYDSPKTDADSYDNALLLAAAPRLLKALKAIIGAFQQKAPVEDYAALLEVAKKIIAEAEPRPSTKPTGEQYDPNKTH
jgi:hypothetical protein